MDLNSSASKSTLLNSASYDETSQKYSISGQMESSSYTDTLDNRLARQNIDEALSILFQQGNQNGQAFANSQPEQSSSGILYNYREENPSSQDNPHMIIIQKPKLTLEQLNEKLESYFANKLDPEILEGEVFDDFTRDFFAVGLESLTHIQKEISPNALARSLKLIMRDEAIKDFYDVSTPISDPNLRKIIAKTHIHELFADAGNKYTLQKGITEKIIDVLVEKGYDALINTSTPDQQNQAISIYEQLLRHEALNTFLIAYHQMNNVDFKSTLILKIIAFTLERSPSCLTDYKEELLTLISKTGYIVLPKEAQETISPEQFEAFKAAANEFSLLPTILKDTKADYEEQILQELKEIFKAASTPDYKAADLIKKIHEDGISQGFLSTIRHANYQNYDRIFEQIMTSYDIQSYLYLSNLTDFELYMSKILRPFSRSQQTISAKKFVAKFLAREHDCFDHFDEACSDSRLTLQNKLFIEYVIPKGYLREDELMDLELSASSEASIAADQLKLELERYAITPKLTLEKFNSSEESVLFGENSEDESNVVVEATLNGVIANIFALYEDNFTDFKVAIYRLLCYMIKRQQSLSELSQSIFVHSTELRSSDVNLKLLIHNLIINSTPFLREKLMLLLSAFNPVPFAIPALDENNKVSYQFVSEAFWVLDDTKRYILSFGVGECQGKSSFLNKVFLTSFEASEKSPFYVNSIDLQTDKYFKTKKREIYILDSHGQIDSDLQQKCFGLFENFIIHVTQKYIKANMHKINALINIISKATDFKAVNVFILIRDVQTTGKPEQEFANTVLHQETYKINNAKENVKLHVFTYPDLGKAREISYFFQRTRENFAQVLNSNPLSRDPIKEKFLQLIPKYEKSIIQNAKKLAFDAVQDIITYIKHDTATAKGLFRLYPLFSEICQHDLERRKSGLFKSTKEEFHKHNMFLKERELLKLARTDRGDLLVKFEDLILSENNIYHINLFIDRLKEEVDNLIRTLQSEREKVAQFHFKKTSNEESGKIEIKRPADLLISTEAKNVSIELFWRELALFIRHNDYYVRNKSIIEAYRSFILSGYPFEIVDGDNYFFPYYLLEQTFSTITSNSKVLVISVLGPQNSGKSTLMNYLFGCSFTAKAGRCTKGIYGTLVKSNVPNYDYILVLDSEGLQSIEKGDPEYDRKITLFCLAVSQIVLFNVKDEVNEEMKNILQICALSLQKIQKAEIPYPQIFFVLNQKADPNMKNHEILLRKIKETLFAAQIDELFTINENNFETLSSAFNNKTADINGGSWCYHTTSNEFLSRIIVLGKKLQEAARSQATVFKASKLPFDQVRQWIEFAHDVFKTINKFPDLAQFQNMQELRASQYIKYYLVEVAKKELSQKAWDQIALNIEKEQADPKAFLRTWFHHKQTKILEEYQKFCEDGRFTKKVKEMGQEHIIVLLSHTEELWIRKFALESWQESAKDSRMNGNNQIKETMRSIIISRESLTESEASERFEEMYNSIISNLNKQMNLDKYREKALAFVVQMVNLFSSLLPGFVEIQKEVEKKELEFVTSCIQSSVFFTKLVDSEDLNDVSLAGEKTKFHYLNQEKIYKDFRKFNDNMNILMQFWGKINSSHHDNILSVLDQRVKIELMDVDFNSKGGLNVAKSRSEEQRSGVFWNTLTRMSPYNIRIKEIAENKDILPLFDMNSKNVSCAKNIYDFTRPFLNFIAQKLLDGVAVAKKYIFADKSYNMLIAYVQKTVEGHEGVRNITQEMTLKLMTYISDHIIKPFNEDLKFFGLKLSDQTESSFYVLTIKKLFDAHCKKHQEPMQKVVDEFESQRESQRNFFISQIVRNAQKDKAVSEKLAQDIRTYFFDRALRQGQQIFEAKIQKIEGKISRHQIQKILDAKLNATTSSEWLYDYIVRPTDKIVEMFNFIWEDAKKEALIEAEQIYQKQAHIVKLITNNMIILKNKLTEIRGFDGNVSDLFYANQGEIDQNIDLQGKAALQFIFTFLNGKAFSSATINFTDFTLVYDHISPSNITPIEVKDKEDQAMVQDLQAFFQNYSISNIVYFIEALTNNLGQVERKLREEKLTLAQVDKENLYQTYKDRAIGCEEPCPCCGRPCDVDHFALTQFAVGSAINKHACTLGHQLRGMNGYKESYTNEASLRFCEEMQDHDRINYNGQMFTWEEFKNEQKSWNFSTIGLSVQDLQRVRDKLHYVWTSIGERICSEKYGRLNIRYVASNALRFQNPPVHFIIALDGSYSMTDKPWKDLMGCMERFLEIRKKENDSVRGREDTLVSCFSFSGVVTEPIIYAEKPSPTLCHQLVFPGGTTNYSNALLKIMRIMDGSDETRKFVIVFMSDGKPDHDPHREFDRLKENYRHRIKDFWTVGFGERNIEMLKKMAESMDGIYKHSNDKFELFNVFVEIARVGAESDLIPAEAQENNSNSEENDTLLDDENSDLYDTSELLKS